MPSLSSSLCHIRVNAVSQDVLSTTLLKDLKMKCTFVLLALLAFTVSARAMALLPRIKTPNNYDAIPRELLKRNATATDDQLQLNINPNIVNPNCGGIFLANIDVQYAPDPFYLSGDCQNVLKFIGGNKGNKNVDVIFTCLGQPINGSGDRNIKVIVNTATDNVLNGKNNGVQEIVGSMEILDDAANTFLSASIQLGVTVDASAGKMTFQYIYC